MPFFGILLFLAAYFDIVLEAPPPKVVSFGVMPGSNRLSMETPAPPATSPESSFVGLGGPTFLSRLAIVTLSLALVALAIYFLREFRTILQPLFIAVFIGYIILPVHSWLVKRGIHSTLAYLVILILILGALFGLGALVYRNVEQLIDRLPEYERKLEKVMEGVAETAGLDVDETMQTLHDFTQFQGGSVDQTLRTLRQALGTFLDFFSMLAVTFIYLVFLVAEKMSFPQRIANAFGKGQGQRIMAVTASINIAISEYIAIKTFISFLAGISSMAVLALFGVDFSLTWGILIFLLNFIPYLGSIVGVTLPIALSFVQLGVWQGFVIAAILIAIQEVIALAIEPRMTGNRLGVSPLLILLSLAFWGVIWGIIGMILAVPLMMVIKIIMENIKETRPLAMLMSSK